MEDGFLVNTAILDGLILGWVQYPGGAVAVASSHLIQAPAAKIDATTTEGDGDFRFPPFTEGMLRTTASAATQSVTSTAQAATLVYTNGLGGFTMTALSTGTSGNKISLRLVSQAPIANIAQPTPTLAVSTSEIAVTLYLAQTSSIPSSTMTMIVAALAVAPFTTYFSIATTGVASTVAAPMSKTFLSGGVSGYGFSYQLANGTASSVIDVLKYVFVARKQAPKQILIEFAQGADSDPAPNLTIVVTDTNQNTVTQSSSTFDVVETSGILRRRYRLLGGTFVPGYRYHVQLTITTPASVNSHVLLVAALTHNTP